MGIVTAAVVVLVLAATAAIGVSGFVTAQDGIDRLWRGLAQGLAERTTEQILRYMAVGEPFTATGVAMLEDGTLDVDDPEGILRFLTVSLDANPAITWASFGDESGRYLAAYRWPRDDGGTSVRRTWREQLPARERHGPSPWPTHFRDWERADDGTWRLIREGEPKPYDPRLRPWYRPVADLPAGAGRWVEPYVMLSRMQIGVAYSRVSRGPDGRRVGVWAAELEGGPISDFLAGLRVSEHGRAYVLDRSGRVIAHPERAVVRADGRDGEGDFIAAAAHPDPMLAESWHAYLALPEGTARGVPFEAGELLAAVVPFPDDSGVPWEVMVVAPAADLFGGVRRSARDSLMVGVGAVLLLLGLGVLFSRRLTRSVGQLRGELSRVARFELDGDPLDSTAVREVNEMREATETMKEGLRSFSRYVPHQLVGRLLREGGEARLGGELAELTVVFSDIAGFTGIVERMPPDDMLQLLGDYLDAMNEAIATTDGTACQYLGDAIMAFWGAPDRQRDHALRACRGVLEMRRRELALRERSRRRGEPELRTRFGVNTGEVMVGNIGAHDRFNYGILGDAVNTASRLEGLNKHYGTGILIGERTAELVGDALVLRPIDWVRVKGKAKPLLVYELLGEPAEVGDDLLAASVAFAAALGAYRDGRFDEALEGFVAVDEQLGGDPPSALLALRCGDCLRDPPSAWDGVYVMAGK